MRRRSNGASAICAAVLVATMLSGCAITAEREAKRVERQEAQLEEYIRQADAWGAEIMAQVPASETESVLPNVGGVRLANDYYQEWPKLYYWSQDVTLNATGARTPTMLANDLEPWLEEQGWVRARYREFPPGDESFERDYVRDRYVLLVEVYTEPPPRAQTVSFTIGSPDTDPDADETRHTGGTQ